MSLIQFKLFTYRIIFSGFVLLTYGNVSYTQNSKGNENIKVESFYKTISELYGANQVIVNGKYYAFSSQNDLGHPFYNADTYKDSYIIIRNEKFENIQLKFDIYRQCVVINNEQVSQEAFSPPSKYISEFTYGESLFRKYSFDGHPDRFYQVIYNNKLKCLYSWKKNRSESDHNFNFSAYRYHSPTKISYVVINGIPNQYSNQSQFLNCFPIEKRKEIKQYIKSNKINIRKATDTTMFELINYCENLTQINNINQ